MLEIPEDKIREFAAGVLVSSDGRGKATFYEFYMSGYRRPKSITVFIGKKESSTFNEEWIFEGEKLEELRALAMQKALQK